jgi:hypothetical protein
MSDETNVAEVLGELLAEYELRIRDTIAKAAVLPPELAAQLASAVRLLHESPPLEQRNDAARPARVTRIERDERGNFVPVYDE